MPKQRNIEIASSLKEKLQKAKGLILTDYRGLTHKQSEDLHRAVKKVDGEFVVAKNSLLRIASQDIKELSGPTAALLAYGDEIAPLKELAKVIKNLNLPKIKFGFIFGQRYEAADIDRLSQLPPYEALQGQVVSRLSSPMYRLVYSLNYNLQKLAYVLANIKT